MLIRCILNQFEGIVTPYTFIAPDPRPLGPGARVTLRRNISSFWDHRRNYPLMPIHKSVGHFQSPARNSRRNTAAIHPHTDATTADTPTFGYTYVNFVPSHGTNITCIVLHDKRPRAQQGKMDVLIPLTEFSLCTFLPSLFLSFVSSLASGFPLRFSFPDS